MADVLLVGLGNCCAQIITQISYSICNNRTYGNSACADNCCRFNCCWKQGALPVEDYPIANSTAADQTQKMDGEPKKDTEGEGLPKYEATPQMSAAAPAVTEAEGSRAGAETVTEEVEREKKASA